MATDVRLKSFLGAADRPPPVCPVGTHTRPEWASTGPNGSHRERLTCTDAQRCWLKRLLGPVQVPSLTPRPTCRNAGGAFFLGTPWAHQIVSGRPYPDLVASLEKRTRSDGTLGYRVRWRDGGARTGKYDSETFDDERAAGHFRSLVELHNHRRPPGWVPGIGFAEAPEVNSGPTLREWSERWLASLSGIADRTRHDYGRDLRLHVLPTLGDMPLQRLSREDVGLWVNRIDDAGKAPKTIKNLHAMLSTLLRAAVHEGLRESNPAERTRLPRLDSHDAEEMVFLSAQEFDTFRAHLAADVRDLATLLVGTGLRWSEATALQVRHIDLLAATPTLQVAQAWKRLPDDSFEIGAPKSKRSRRTVALSPQLVDLLIPLVAGRASDELVFTARNGGPWRHGNFYNRRWIPALHAANVCGEHRKEPGRKTSCGCPGTLGKRPRIHDLRHTHCAWLIAAGVPLPAIQRRLGHSSITTTIDRYGHLLPQLDGQVVDAVAAALRPAPQPISS